MASNLLTDSQSHQISWILLSAKNSATGECIGRQCYQAAGLYASFSGLCCPQKVLKFAPNLFRNEKIGMQEALNAGNFVKVLEFCIVHFEEIFG